MRLLFNVAPQTANTFAAADAGLVGQLVMTLGQEFERAISTRMQDIHDMKTLLRDAPVTAVRKAFLDQQPASLHLRDVNAVHDTGMRLISDWHAEVETVNDVLNRRIWAYLRDHSERHRFD
jgi:hypothetical protein